MILVQNREMIFLNKENYIGTTYDNQSTNRVFKIERQCVDGVDVGSLLFHMQIMYEDGSEPDEMLLEKELHDKYVLLIWTIPDTMLSHAGAHLIGIKGFEASGNVRYSTYPAFVFVEDWIDAPEPDGEKLTAIEQLSAKVDQYKQGYQLSVDATADAVKATGEAQRAASDADLAAENANAVAKEVTDKLASGDLNGPPGKKGDPGQDGEQGPSGVLAPSAGMFVLELDPATGNLYAVYPSEENPPKFEYDPESGDLYYVVNSESGGNS